MPLTRDRVWPKPILRWHESWIFRAAGVAVLILFCGFAASIFISVQSIDTMTRLAYDEKVDQTLQSHLNQLKQTHTLSQQVIVERLKPSVVHWIDTHGPSIDEATLRAWLPHAVRGLDFDVSTLEIIASDTRPDPTAMRNLLKWADRDHLVVIDRIIAFPKGQLYETFKTSEEVKIRYSLVGEQLQKSIKPNLIRASIAVLAIAFILLTFMYFVMARRFRGNVMEVVTGFYKWSDEDQDFRFHDRWRGELHLITTQFNAMAEEVEANRQKSLYLEKIASWQTIARKLAHEIKNPLTPIQMMVSQLKRRYKPLPDGTDKDFVKLLDEAQTIISEEVAGLRRMVDNFSTFARLPLPTPKPSNLVLLVHHVVELQKAAFPNHYIESVTNLSAATAHIDEDLIRQVIINLIKNAVEAFGPSSSDKRSVIRVDIKDQGSTYALTIEDNGPGIPGDLQGQIFEAYFTTKHTGPTPGMGLGLAICQKIVLDHGGGLSVRSRPGQTVFMMTLPKYKKGQESI